MVNSELGIRRGEFAGADGYAFMGMLTGGGLSGSESVKMAISLRARLTQARLQSGLRCRVLHRCHRLEPNLGGGSGALWVSHGLKPTDSKRGIAEVLAWKIAWIPKRDPPNSNSGSR